MEVHYLYEFAKLAESGNYLQTSADLFISQSSLSKHIMSLEKELGMPLFERTTRKVRLSPEGELLLPYALKINQLINEFTSVVEFSKKVEKNTLSITSTSQLPHYTVITEALADYKRIHLDCTLDINVEPHKNLKRLLLEHKTDFIWIGEPEDEFQDPEFARIPFSTEPLVAVLLKEHPLASRQVISLKMLQNQDILIQDNSSIEQKVFVDFCAKRNFNPKITSLPGGSVLNFAKQNLGIAIMLRSVALNLMGTESTTMAEIEDSPIVHVNLVYLKGQKLTEPAKSFLEFLATWTDTD